MEGSYELNRFTLWFRDPSIERDYQVAWGRRALKPLRWSMALAVFVMLQGIVTDRYLATAEAAARMVWIRVGIGIPLLLAIFALTWLPAAQRRLQDTVTAGLFLLLLTLMLPSLIYAPPSPPIVILGSTQLILVSTFVLFSLGFVRSTMFALGVLAGTHFAVHYHHMTGPDVFGIFFMQHLTTLVCTVGGYLTERRDRQLFVDERLLAEERDVSERLLLNILPGSIARRLKGGAETIADAIHDVGVLFSDIVGFTGMSARLSPEETVRRLNEMFTTFDALAARHGLEKIKTIGDAYMVISGAPETREDHLMHLADMALEMQRSVVEVGQRLGEPLGIRIGIHAGPVVAGVIGKRKFSYDLWGDTVNTASRMESHGIEGGIQVSDVVQARLQGHFVLEERGTVEIKGKGPMRTWLLKGRRQGPATTTESGERAPPSAQPV
ncbi:MAG: adenylate/guanylate cyclase domain-containing protein [Myxococcota bacterium]